MASHIIFLTALLTCFSSFAAGDEPVQSPDPAPVFSVTVDFSELPLPDLVIPVDRIIFDPAEPFQGQTVYINYTVQNVGEAAAGSFKTGGYSIKENGEREIIKDMSGMKENELSYLAPGSEAEGRLRWDVFDNAGANSICLIADKNNHVLESNEINNSATTTLQVADNYRTLTYRANSLLASGEEEAAKAKYREAIQTIRDGVAWAEKPSRYMESIDYKYLLYCLLMLGENEKAVEEGTPGHERFSNEFQLAYLLASAHLKLGATEEAKHVIREVAGKRKEGLSELCLLDVFSEEGKTLDDIYVLKKEDRESYGLLLETISERLPGIPDVWIALGVRWQQDKDSEKAASAFDRGFELAGEEYYVFENYHVLIGWIDTLRELGRDEEAFRHVKAGLDHYGRPFHLLFWHATMGFQIGASTPDQTLLELEQLLSMDATPFWMTRIYNSKGNILRKEGDVEGARRAYQKSLEADPDYVSSAKALEELSERKEDKDEQS